MTEAQEDETYNSQQKWIEDNINPTAAKSANYGWGVDHITEEISTKVYGYGVLTTHVPTMTHTFDSF